MLGKKPSQPFSEHGKAADSRPKALGCLPALRFCECAYGVDGNRRVEVKLLRADLSRQRERQAAVALLSVETLESIG